MDEQNKGIEYSDSDVAKLAGAETTPTTSADSDDMFEDLYVPGSTQEEAPAQDTTWTIEWDVEQSVSNAVAEESATEWEPTTNTEEGSEGMNADELSDDELPPEVRALLDSINAGSENVEEAQQAVDEAISWGNIEEIRKANDDLKVANADLQRQVDQLKRQLSSERANSDRLLDENMLQQANNRESAKTQETLANNPTLKQMVIYAWFPEDERSQSELKELSRRFFEETNGVSVDDLLENRKRNEKMEMGEWAYDTTGTTPNSDNLGGMLEDLS